MSRLAVLCSVLALGGLIVLGTTRADSEQTKQAEPAKPAKTESLAAKLQRPVKFAGFDDVKTTLRDALDVLSKTHGIDIEVNEKAFKAEGINDVLETQIAEKPIAKREKIRLDRLLRTILARIPIPSGATFLVRGDGIEVTTIQLARHQVWGSYNGPFLPLVNTTFEKRTLQDALKELADQSEYNVVLDAKVGEKANTEVSARFANTPLDTAAAFLADMAELRTVLLDNVVYVTTRENAAVWEGRLKKDPMIDDANAAPGPRIGSGVGNPSPMPQQAGGM
jgi:hypothetical protein